MSEYELRKDIASNDRPAFLSELKALRDRFEYLLVALRPFAALQPGKKYNAGAYSILFDDIVRARSAVEAAALTAPARAKIEEMALLYEQGPEGRLVDAAFVAVDLRKNLLPALATGGDEDLIAEGLLRDVKISGDYRPLAALDRLTARSATRSTSGPDGR